MLDANQIERPHQSLNHNLLNTLVRAVYRRCDEQISIQIISFESILCFCGFWIICSDFFFRLKVEAFKFTVAVPEIRLDSQSWQKKRLYSITAILDASKVHITRDK